MCWPSVDRSREWFRNSLKSGNIDSRKYWEHINILDLLKHELEDSTMQTMFLEAPLSQDFEGLLLPWWRTGNDLDTKVVENLLVPDYIKTLIYKVKQEKWFILTLLHILKFDDYPLLLYRRYDPFTNLFANVEINDWPYTLAGPKMEILSQTQKKFIVIEGARTRNTKLCQVAIEKFIAVHKAVQKYKDVSFPIDVYAMRVLDTRFTFYKASVEEDYIKETSCGFPTEHSLIIQRHPPMGSYDLPAYDFNNVDDRCLILKCIAQSSNGC